MAAQTLTSSERDHAAQAVKRHEERPRPVDTADLTGLCGGDPAVMLPISSTSGRRDRYGLRADGPRKHHFPADP